MFVDRARSALWLVALIWLLTACEGRKWVAGRLLDQRGNAIPEAEVDLAASNVQGTSTRTALDGSYGLMLRFGWRPGCFTVRAHAPGYKPMVASLESGEEWCDFVLAPLGGPGSSAASCAPNPP